MSANLAAVTASPAPSRPTLIRLPGCYPVQADTWLLADTLRELDLASGADVLDLCTGTGALAVAAGLEGAASVTAVDISLRSAANAWLNSRRHGVTARVLRGDLFEALLPGQQFDVVLSNPPYVPGHSDRLPRHTVSRCWDAGVDGRRLLDRICAGAADRLRPGGSLLLVQSAVADHARSVRRLRRQGLDVAVVRRERVPFGPVMRARAELIRARGLGLGEQDVEELVVIRASRASEQEASA
ncbi:HemK2/MTQ2 family protein methyltransferase [Knoellia sp. Soil729]|uniref:HemK2/MTQ2 family protein methyltransferase n=1 Tax=Knoellia sp. Soil729 TaxID=1736394 RepID=UPI0006F203F5|nr:HemK2/MTQ2 family protein methyltransferase [Knoellia sp. Soil729]KRE40831.1 hypothetical protein ASG74_15250 [Knoellia sp. Soil729]